MNIARTAVNSAFQIGNFNNITLKCLNRNYAFKSDLKIKWVRPEKIPCINPKKSGDLEPMKQVDLNQPQLIFRNSKELETADETVKKLFSLNYASRNKATEVYRHEMKEMVKRHNFDVGSVEVKLARMTAVIRALQDVMERFPRNKRMKVMLKEAIDHRKKIMKFLRRWDYKKFEWVLEKLNLEFKPPPNHFHWITRKESLRKLTDKYCEEIREDRLKVYREMLEAEQPAFLQEKLRALEFIRDEQKDCGVEVTVTDEEIDAVKQQLKEVEEKRKLNNEAV